MYQLSDCLRAVPQSNNLSFEYRYPPASFAPRPRLERGTYCLGGIPERWLAVAGCGLTCRSAVARMAGCGLAWPRACGRWLPVWLPGIWLATLMFECLYLVTAIGITSPVPCISRVEGPLHLWRSSRPTGMRPAGTGYPAQADSRRHPLKTQNPLLSQADRTTEQPARRHYPARQVAIRRG
jgi:hypothetical protein